MLPQFATLSTSTNAHTKPHYHSRTDNPVLSHGSDIPKYAIAMHLVFCVALHYTKSTFMSFHVKLYAFSKRFAVCMHASTDAGIAVAAGRHRSTALGTITYALIDR
jgi:hypothetical protein